MTWAMDAFTMVFMGFAMLMMLGGVGAAVYAGWQSLPDTGRTALKRALMRVAGRPGSAHPQEQVYTVRVDGHLRYASGQEDVRVFLHTAMLTASRQVLLVMDQDTPVTLVFTCGNQSVVIDVSLG